MLKKISIVLIIILLLITISNNVLAKEKYTTTSTINEVVVNWEYELNDSNEIENLKCTNSTQLTGNITIPSTLEGKKVTSLAREAFKSATSMTGVTIANTIKEIGMWAFSGCSSLSNINLGNVEKISEQSFKNCTSVTSIKIPKTLNRGASGAPFLGCTNLKTIELEEGMTVVPSYLCSGTAITEITIPSTVKEIEISAFSGCNSLSNINLGNVEKIGEQSFKNCTSLTSIKIPKSLNKGASGAPFLGCTNLKTIELEEGMTVIPKYLCSETRITDITIPNTVKEIDLWAFSNCSELKKITILDSVEDIGDYISSNTDIVFQNHNEDLTIYCYEDSLAAKYAIKYQIKYVYLPRPIIPDEKDTQKDEKNQVINSDGSITSKDKTIANGILPQTGLAITGILIALVLSTVSIIFYIKYRKFRKI